LHSAREVQAKILFNEISNASLARLRVHPDDCFVSLPEICGINGKVGHIPVLGLAFDNCLRMTDSLSFKAFFDGILVRSRKCCKDQFTSVWMSRVDREIIALGNSVNYALEITEIEVGLDALGIQI